MSVNTLIDLPWERGVEMEASKLNFVECKIAHKSPLYKTMQGLVHECDQLVLYFVSRCRQPSPWWTPVHRESTLTSHQNGRNNRYETMYRGRKGEREGKRDCYLSPLLLSDPITYKNNHKLDLVLKEALNPSHVPMAVPGNEARIMYKEFWNDFGGGI